MKKLLALFISFVRSKSRERAAQVQRFERLDHYLSCCSNNNHLDQFDALQDRTLLPDDYISIKYRKLMMLRFQKEKELALSEIELQNIRIMEGESILKLYGLCSQQ